MVEIEKNLEEKLWDLRDEYLKSLKGYSFTDEKSLKKEYQNMVFYQQIATKHFLEFALNRIEKITLKDAPINNEALKNPINRSFMTMTCGVEDKEAEMVVFSSSNLELEFVFDYEKKEVTMKGKRVTFFEKKETFCHVIPFQTFNILGEYMPRTQFNISENYKDRNER